MKERESDIAPGIEAAHSRLAETWGLSDLHGHIPLSYGYWCRSKVLEALEVAAKTYLHKPPQSILDAGCGNGDFSQILAKRWPRAQVIGVDFSHEMLSVAVRRAETSGYAHRFEAIESDLESLSCLPQDYFDLVWCFGVIEHLDRPKEVLQQLLNVVAVNGIVIVKIPRKWSTGYFDFMLTGQSPRRWGLPQKLTDTLNFKDKARYYRYFTPSKIKASLQHLNGLGGAQLLPVKNRSQPLGGILLRQPLINRLGTKSLSILNAIDTVAGTFYRIPVSEFAILSKTSFSAKAPGARDALKQ